LNGREGLWIQPVELPISNPFEFEWGRSIGSHLASWPREHVVKCLVQYHPDDTIENRLEQEAQLMALYQAVPVSGHELLLEVIPPRNLPQMHDTVLRALTRLCVSRSSDGIAPQLMSKPAESRSGL
jgi:5-dehydro-2-deoxygluconokinase